MNKDIFEPKLEYRAGVLGNCCAAKLVRVRRFISFDWTGFGFALL